jgi:hypothetical protein
MKLQQETPLVGRSRRAFSKEINPLMNRLHWREPSNSRSAQKRTTEVTNGLRLKLSLQFWVDFPTF